MGALPAEPYSLAQGIEQPRQRVACVLVTEMERKEPLPEADFTTLCAALPTDQSRRNLVRRL